MTGYKDIYQRYKQQILSGQYKPGEQVPAIRLLADELGVAKKTVETAYNILIGEGYLVARGARGTFVNPDLQPLTAIASPTPLQPQNSNLRDAGFFRLGIPALDVFPYKKWLLLCGKASRAMQPAHMLLPPVQGYQPLREAIANYLNISRGINCHASQICLTSGYKQSIALILQALAQPNDPVVFEEPGYFFGQQLLQRLVKHLHHVPVDQQGLDVDYLLRQHHDARFVITTPTHHSPLAVTLSLPRRQKLLDWAKAQQAWIIEDDYDGEFHYTKKVLPALKSQDHADRVIYVGTFSKTIMPSIRLSYLVLPKTLVAPVLAVAEVAATGLPLQPQQTLALFLHEGHFFRHLKKMRALYQARRLMVRAAFELVFPGLFEFARNDGGMHLVARFGHNPQSSLHNYQPDVPLATLWQQQQLQVMPLSAWYAGANKSYGLVVGYTNIRSIDEAVQLLQRVKQDTLALLTDSK